MARVIRAYNDRLYQVFRRRRLKALLPLGHFEGLTHEQAAAALAGRCRQEMVERFFQIRTVRRHEVLFLNAQVHGVLRHAQKLKRAGESVELIDGSTSHWSGAPSYTR